MKSFLVPAFVALCCALPASAQKYGSTNDGAPRCTSSIAAGDLKVEVAFTSITLASGKTMEQLTSEKGENARTRMNSTAEKAPLGEFKTSADLTLGGKTVKAGTYSLFFTIDKDLKFHLNLVSGEAKHDWTLDLKDAGQEMKRLHISLGAGDENGTAKMTIGFAKKVCHIAVAPAGGKGGDKGGDKEGKGH